MDARTLAEKFHETYESLAPNFGYETRSESAKSWADIPESSNNKRLMIATCEVVLKSLDSHLWIKITDDPQTLPKDGDPVWAFSPSQFIRVSPCWFRERGERWTSAHGQCVSLERGPTFRCDQSIGYYDVSQISHWMPRPFPAPPPES